MLRQFIVLLSLALSLNSQAQLFTQAEFSWPQGVDQIDLPVQAYGGRLLVGLDVDGAERLWLMFDSHATESVVYQSAWHKLSGLNIDAENEAELSGTIGALKVKRLDVTRQTCTSCPDYDGIMGNHLLHEFALLWSPAKPQIRLYPQKSRQIISSGRVYRMHWYQDKPAIEVRLKQGDDKNLRAKLWIDTANQMPMEVMPVTSWMKQQAATARQTGVYQDDGVMQAVIKVPEWQWEYTSIRDVPVLLADSDDYGEPVAGRVGTAILSRMALLFDLYGQRIVVKTPVVSRQSPSLNLSGLRLQRTSLGTFVVAHRDPIDSQHGANRIIQGDVINQINNGNATGFSQTDIDVLLANKYRIKLCREADDFCESIEISHQLSLPSE